MRIKRAFLAVLILLAASCSKKAVDPVAVDQDHMTKAQAQELADRLNRDVKGTCGRRYVKQRRDGSWVVLPSSEGCPDIDHVRVVDVK
jgi:hypothetical protein